MYPGNCRAAAHCLIGNEGVAVFRLRSGARSARPRSAQTVGTRVLTAWPLSGFCWGVIGEPHFTILLQGMLARATLV